MGSEVSHSLPRIKSSSTDKTDDCKSICSALNSISSPKTPGSGYTVETKSNPIHKRNRSSILLIDNGITNKHISSRICQIAANFWQQNVESLSVSDQLEIAVSIFFSMVSTNAEMKHIMGSNLTGNKKIEEMSLKYLYMMGWLIRHLVTDNIDLHALLSKLGVFHRKMGINIKHFKPMLCAINETFSYYFGSKYDITIKYVIEEIFLFAAKTMTGKDLKIWGSSSSHFNLHSMDDVSFLKDLKICLNSSVGKDYLYRYLTQTLCDEIVIFLKTLCKFKKSMNDKQRFFIARNITKISIQSSAAFTLNLSYGTRINTLNEMNVLEQRFSTKQQLEISTDFFTEVETEVYKLIIDNHWSAFVREIQTLQSKRFCVD